jgi:hypothetical protein
MFGKVRVFEVHKFIRRLPSYVTVYLYDPVLSAQFKSRHLYEIWALSLYLACWLRERNIARSSGAVVAQILWDG